MTVVEAVHALGPGTVKRRLRLGHRRHTTSVLVKSHSSRCERVLHGVDIGCRSERTRCVILILPEHSWRTIGSATATGILFSAATAGIGRGSNDAARGKSGDGREKGNTLPQPFRLALGRSLNIMLVKLHNSPNLELQSHWPRLNALGTSTARPSQKIATDYGLGLRET